MSKRIPTSSLINLIRSCSGRHAINPKGNYSLQFVLFLGAGASVSSNVVAAGAMTDVFRQQYLYQHPTTKFEFEKWYDEETAYSELFERLYPEPSSRRDYIEQLLQYAKPSWGYVY